MRIFRLTQVPVLVVLVSALAVLPTGPAAAHLGIETSSPSNAAELVAAPTEATLTFNAAVDIDTAEARLRRLGPPDTAINEVTNRDVPTEELNRISTDGRTAVFDLPDLEPGLYAIDWAVFESGGHSNASFIAFRITGSNAATDDAAPGGSTGDRVLLVAGVVGVAVAVVLVAVNRRRGTR